MPEFIVDYKETIVYRATVNARSKQAAREKVAAQIEAGEQECYELDGSIEPSEKWEVTRG